MNEKLKRMTVVVVGFKVDSEHSVYYRKLDTPSDSELGKHLNVAFHGKDCDFVSVRRIKMEKATTQ